MSTTAKPYLATIHRIDRLNNSVNGNPRFRLMFADASEAITSSDAAINYEIGNPGYRVGSTVALTFTKAGRIAYMNTLDISK
jgi:hypothetical protein